MKKLFNILIFTLTVVLITATSNLRQNEITDDRSHRFVIDENFFTDSHKIYTSEHDILSILMPLNAINFSERQDNDVSTVIFFVEGDIKDGAIDYKGLSMLKNKKATKILENGTDAAATRDNSKSIYISSTDGIYVYENDIKKFGNITDNLMSIAKVNDSDTLYVLNDRNELYKVSEEGTKKELITDIKAKQIVLDYSNNLYFHDGKKVYVLTNGVVKKVGGLPNFKYIRLIKPPFNTEEVPVVLDDKIYIVFANGKVELSEFQFAVQPSAYSMEATMIQYYGFNRSIYEFDLLNIIFSGLFSFAKD